MERRFEAAEVTGGKDECLHESRWTKRWHMVDLGEGARGAVECSGGQQWSTGRNSTFNGAIMMQFERYPGDDARNESEPSGNGKDRMEQPGIGPYVARSFWRRNFRTNVGSFRP